MKRTFGRGGAGAAGSATASASSRGRRNRRRFMVALLHGLRSTRLARGSFRSAGARASPPPSASYFDAFPAAGHEPPGDQQSLDDGGERHHPPGGDGAVALVEAEPPGEREAEQPHGDDGDDRLEL